MDQNYRGNKTITYLFRWLLVHESAINAGIACK